MCLFGTPKIPTPTVKQAPAAPALMDPLSADTGAKSAANEERRRRAAASGWSDTLLTGGSGLKGQASTGGKTLLGQ